ncbi:MAG: FecR domain-containing protein [Spirochaetales bacterium]|nr:FecR domain-containing protein [Spirochaetales bacterium]
MKLDELSRLLIDRDPDDWPASLAGLKMDDPGLAGRDAEARALLAHPAGAASRQEKKSMNKSILLSLAALVLVAVGVGIYLSRGGQSDVPAGVIQIVFGRASLALQQESRELTASQLPPAGLPFAEGSILKTGPASAAQLIFRGGIVSRIGENTQVTLTRSLVQEAGSELTEIGLEGQFSYRSGPLKGSFAVRTPTAVASVRGTEFNLSSSPALTILVVHDGQVDLEAVASANKARVMAGQRATVDAAGNILVGPVQAVDTIERAQFQRDDDVFRKYGTGPLNTELELDSEEAIKKHYGRLYTVRLLDGREYTGYPSFHGAVLQIHTTYGVIEMDRTAVLSLDELK